MLYFILSKIMSFLINPMFWIFLMVMVAILYPKKRKKMLMILLITILLLGNTVLTNFAIHLWEKNQFATHSTLANYDSYIILGGFNSWNPYTGMQDCNAAGDRLFNMLIFLQDSSKNVIISGGSGRLIQDSLKEADITHRYLSDLSKMNAHILYENSSKNTVENIQNSLVLVDSMKFTKPCVVSSAMHIRRVKKILEKEHLNWDAYGVESAENLNPRLYDYFIPNASNLSAWNFILHEWIGYLII